MRFTTFNGISCLFFFISSQSSIPFYQMLKRVSYKLRQKICRAVIVPIERNPRTNDNIQTHKRKTNFKDFLTRHTHVISYELFHFKNYRLSFKPTYSVKMNCVEMQQFKPPASVKGMVKLDRSKFDDMLKVPTIIIPVKNLQMMLKKLRKYGLKLKHLSPVLALEQTHPDFDSHKRFLFDPRKFETHDELTEMVQSILGSENAQTSSIEFYELKVSYENWNFQEVMQAIIPDDIESISGFAEVGHIAHFNLRDEMLPYKHIIGEVLLDKIPAVKTVVNKLSSIDNTYRTFQMELLAGEDNYVTRTKENSYVFELDFSKVYWNTRLGTEHHRMTNSLSCGDIVFDVFAGIGPFAIPAAKRRATVYANDLNPYSYENLLKNIKLNKCDTSLITCSNLDGREFINTVMKDKLKQIFTEGVDKEGMNVSNISSISVLMNLPALAYTFLDAFSGILSDVDNFNTKVPLPIINCYCFTNLPEANDKWGGDTDAELKHRVTNMVEGLQEDDVTVRFVRDVAPLKLMMCVSFKLTQEIMCGTKKLKRNNTEETEVTPDEPPTKCQKTESNASISTA